MKASTPRPVLVVTSGSGGHRQNYAAVLGRWFAETGHSVVIACGPGEGGLPASQTPILAQFLAKSGAVASDLEKDVVQEPARFRARLTQLETDLNPTWTLLVNGEECVRALQGEWPRESNQRRRAAIFIYFPQEYPLDLRPHSFWDKLRPWARHLRERHRKRRFFKREAGSRLGLDLILSMDEHAVAALSHPQVRYLPEIYRAWGSDIGPERPEIGPARLAYAEFLGRHPGKDVLLYYGGRFMRRGYDTLLALALEHQETVFVSVGRDASGEGLAKDAGLCRQQLAAQDRLFELDLPFLPENSLVDDLFRSTRYVILPYQHWYGLSGSLLQAASYGSPVLVPDIGSMAGTVRHYGIGLTYRHLDLKHLRRQFDEMRRDPARFRDNALRFSRRVNEKAVFAALAAIFGAE
jgi:glycosyltransferase involved in cell wall biosynthesis